MYIKNVEGQRKAKIIVVRDSGFAEHGIDYRIYLNGAYVATLKPGERFDIAVEAGKHKLGVALPEFYGDFPMTPTDITVEPDKEYFYRVVCEGKVTPGLSERRIVPYEQ